MILATVGCSNFMFDRLFCILDELCEEGVLNGDEILAQTGNIRYEIRHYRHFDFIDHEQMAAYQDEADLVICHAGTGSVIGALKRGKKVIAFPRLRRFEEHESDHQLELAREFTDAGYIRCAMDKAELAEAIRSIDTFTPKPFASNREHFCALVRELLG